MFNKFFFENRAIYEIMWKNIVQPDRPQVTIRRMRLGCWIPKARDTPSEYATFTAFPLQQKLQEHTPMLRYKYNACLVNTRKQHMCGNTVLCTYKQYTHTHTHTHQCAL